MIGKLSIKPTLISCSPTIIFSSIWNPFRKLAKGKRPNFLTKNKCKKIRSFVIVLIFVGFKTIRYGKITKSLPWNYSPWNYPIKHWKPLKNQGFSCAVPYWTRFMAERAGFEPACPLRQTDFESAPLWPLRYLSVFGWMWACRGVFELTLNIIAQSFAHCKMFLKYG